MILVQILLIYGRGVIKIKEYTTQVYDESAELSIIGSLLVNNEFILKTTYLKEKHFYFPELASIYESMQILISEGIIRFDTLSIINTINANINLKNNIYK